MKVFVFSSLTTNYQFDKYDTVISEYLKNNGYTNLCDNSRTRSSIFLKNLDEQGISAYQKRHKELINNLKRADACIFEISHPSWATGFLVSKALDFGKPVIALYLKNHNSFYLAGIKEEKLLLTQYNSIHDLQKKLPSLFQTIKEVSDRRFNFYIPSELITFIQKQSKKMGKTKSTFLRDIIREYMEKTT